MINDDSAAAAQTAIDTLDGDPQKVAEAIFYLTQYLADFAN